MLVDWKHINEQFASARKVLKVVHGLSRLELFRNLGRKQGSLHQYAASVLEISYGDDRLGMLLITCNRLYP